MPSKAEFYRQMAEQASTRLVGSWRNRWNGSMLRNWECIAMRPCAENQDSQKDEKTFGIMLCKPLTQRQKG